MILYKCEQSDVSRDYKELSVVYFIYCRVSLDRILEYSLISVALLADDMTESGVVDDYLIPAIGQRFDLRCVILTEDFLKLFKDEISILISDKENVIWGIIHDIIYYKKTDNMYSVNYVKKLILAYIRVSEMIGETPPYCSVEDFFCCFNSEGRNEYDKFLQFSENHEGEQLIENDLEFILNHTEGEICRDILAVLNDNGNDPHFSAVYTTNMIKCFILISNQIGANHLYKDVCGFFIAHGYSQKHFFDFERKRKEEAEYYRSVQY